MDDHAQRSQTACIWCHGTGENDEGETCEACALPDDEPSDNCRTINELHLEAWYEDRRW